ncbi:MAG: hypothetical protein ACRDAM_02230, partial [Casimicrobium sp.]
MLNVAYDHEGQTANLTRFRALETSESFKQTDGKELHDSDVPKRVMDVVEQWYRELAATHDQVVPVDNGRFAYSPSSFQPYRLKTEAEQTMDWAMLHVEVANFDRAEQLLSSLPDAIRATAFAQMTLRRLHVLRARSADDANVREQAFAEANQYAEGTLAALAADTAPYGFGDNYLSAESLTAIAQETIAEYRFGRNEFELALRACEAASATGYASSFCEGLRAKALLALGRESEAFEHCAIWGGTWLTEIITLPRYQAFLAERQSLESTAEASRIASIRIERQDETTLPKKEIEHWHSLSKEMGAQLPSHFV